MRRTTHWLLGLLLLSTAALSQSTLTIARPADVRALNPIRQANNSTSEVTYQMHEGLVTMNPEQEIVPVLATSWELLDDGLTYRINLREGVTFHSGAPFDAEAVRWNFERQLTGEQPGIAAGLLPAYSAITVVDEHTIDVTLTRPNGVYMNILAAPLFMIVDPSRYEELGEDYGNDPSGTGPFRFVSWEPDQRVVLERNPEYWDPGNGAAVDRVVFEVMPEPSARVIALQTGEVDMAFSTPAEEIDRITSSPDFQVFSTPTMRVVWIGLNVVDPILSSVDVRRALAYAIDREQMMAVVGNNGVAAEGIGVPAALGFKPSVRPYEPDTARELLEQEGWTEGGDGIRTKDGERLEITVLTQGTSAGELEALQVVQLQLREVGVDMVIERVDGGAMFARLNEESAANVEDESHIPDYQAWVVGSGIRTGEVGYISETAKCDQGARNWSRYCNPAYDDAFNLSQSTASVDERLEGYFAMADLYYEDVLQIPLYVLQANIAASADVEGFVPNPNDSLNLRGVSVNR